MKAAMAKIDADKSYALDEATQLVKDVAFAKFDSGVDIAVRSGG